MNLTVTEPTGSWLRVGLPGIRRTRPYVSNLNFDAGATVPNLASVGLTNAQATIFVASAPTVVWSHMVADVFAYIL